jgi:hypothetical protein
MKFLISILAIILPFVIFGKDPPPVKWPDLKTVAFVSGRAATQEDAKEGRAVFVLGDAGKLIGEPMKITIPQYAYHLDSEKKRTPCVIIQAEEARGQKLIGCFTLPDGGFMVGMYSEFIFLGDTPPVTQ